MKNFSRFIIETRGVSYTIRGDEIELDGVLLSDSERDALLAEFEAWEPPGEVDADADLVAAIEKATNIAELKAALLGKMGSQRTRVAGRAK